MSILSQTSIGIKNEFIIFKHHPKSLFYYYLSVCLSIIGAIYVSNASYHITFHSYLLKNLLSRKKQQVSLHIVFQDWLYLKLLLIFPQQLLFWQKLHMIVKTISRNSFKFFLLCPLNKRSRWIEWARQPIKQRSC